MRTPFWLVFSAVLALKIAGAETKMPENQPVEITSSGETTYENGLATSQGNVAIHVGDTDIYADSAQYNSRTHEIFADGNVRIYRETNLYIADHAIYNLDTKQVRTGKMRTEYNAYFLAGQSVNQISENGYDVQDANFTTHDSPNPNFHLHARTVRVYENDHVVFLDVTFYIGDVPVLWWPYLYQSLNDAFNFTISPAYLSSWGFSVLSQLTFPITDDIKGRIRLDYRGRRGIALGFESDIDYGKDNSSNAKLKTYYIQDQNPLINRTDLPRKSVPTGRYRFSLEDHTNFTDDIYAIIDVTKLSDPFVMQDFYQNEFRLNPVPDDVVALTKRDTFWTLTAIARFQGNQFFDQTERLPEIVLDIQRHPIFDGPVFYEGESGIANLHRSFADNSGFESYGTTRLDTFHQLTLPNTYFGWLSIVPRAGFRATYYGETRDLGKTLFSPENDPLEPSFLPLDPTPRNPIVDAGSGVRTIFNTGAEASFKMSRKWDDVESSAFGLDGLMHVIQPFTNFSYVRENGIDPSAVLQFDRFEPSTQLRPLDFPEFTSIDSIADWSIWRVGVRNRLETRRDDVTVTWLELETYCEINFQNPYDHTQYSNFFNNLRFTPLPWTSLTVNSQIPAFDRGFTEVNTTLSVQPVANLQVSVGHRYLNDNPFFENSSLFVVGGYYRLNDNWGVGMQEQYEAETGVLEQQRYAVYRDLTNWVASFGAVVRDNNGVKEYGVLLTITLKAFPKFGFDFNFDPGSAGENQ